MNSNEKIVFTGAGAVCAAGRTVDAIWEAVLNGRSAITPITEWDTSGWPVHMAGETTGVDNRTLVEDRKLHKLISRTDMFGLYAAGVAIQESGLIAHRESLDAAAAARFNDRSGIFVGTGSGGGNDRIFYEFFPAMTVAQGDLQVLGREFSNSVNPMLLLKHLPNNVLCHLGIRHNFKGTNACITNHCVGGVLAVAEAASALRFGEADRATAVGHDKPLEPEMVFYYQRLGLLADDETVRPFDRNRGGTVLGEGAAALVLEKAADAEARGAAVIGQYLGSGCVTEATGILDVRADGDGVSRAIRLALADAGISTDAIGMIVAHGNGTKVSDASEAAAIRHVFGENIPPVTAFKWAFGHSLAPSGLLDLVLALRALRAGVVPAIPTLRTIDPGLAPFPVSTSPQKPRSDVALILCRGFGGTDAAILVRADSSRGA